MLSEPVWLTEKQAIRINERLVGETDEPHILLNAGLLSSGLARAPNRWYYGESDLGNLAGILLLGIGMNHPFQQGNKRTALAAAKIFLQFNNYTFVAPDGEPLGMLVERAIQRDISEETFLRAMRACAIPTSDWNAYVRRKAKIN